MLDHEPTSLWSTIGQVNSEQPTSIDLAPFRIDRAYA
jgi:hypothetical protein